MRLTLPWFQFFYLTPSSVFGSIASGPTGANPGIQRRLFKGNDPVADAIVLRSDTLSLSIWELSNATSPESR